MYATERDRRQTKASLNASALWGWGITELNGSEMEKKLAEWYTDKLWDITASENGKKPSYLQRNTAITQLIIKLTEPEMKFNKPRLIS